MTSKELEKKPTSWFERIVTIVAFAVLAAIFIPEIIAAFRKSDKEKPQQTQQNQTPP